MAISQPVSCRTTQTAPEDLAVECMHCHSPIRGGEKYHEIALPGLIRYVGIYQHVSCHEAVQAEMRGGRSGEDAEGGGP